MEGGSDRSYINQVVMMASSHSNESSVMADIYPQMLADAFKLVSSSLSTPSSQAG